MTRKHRPATNTMTREHEVDLIVRAKAGENAAYEELHDHWARWISWHANYYHRHCPTADVDDLLQEGRLGLLIAIQRFEPERGLRFMTFGGHWVRNRMRFFCAYRANMIHIPLCQPQLRGTLYTLSLDHAADNQDDPLQAFVSGDEEDPSEPASRNEASTLLHRILALLPKRERFVLTHRRLRHRTLREIGEILGVTKERVRQIEVRAMKRAAKIAESLGNVHRSLTGADAALAVA